MIAFKCSESFDQYFTIKFLEHLTFVLMISNVLNLLTNISRGFLSLIFKNSY